MIVNAAHAIEDVKRPAGEKGVISIATRHTKEWVEITIRDSGCGIPEATRARVFDPFFTTKEVGRGTGQGLTIARHVVVEKLHGSIGLESSVGAGSTFIVRLPLDSAARSRPEVRLANHAAGSSI
jgi:signal transduction histidine kinase